MHKCRLSDIATFSQGKQIPVEEQFVHKAQNLNRFIRIIDYTDQSTEPRYTNENSDRYKVSKTDLVMIRYGSQTAGKVVRGFDGVIANNMFRINFITPENYDMNFMYFYLSSPHIYNFLMKAQVSSTMPAITFDMLSDIWITIPELHRQKLIGEVLNTINIKIELNNKINAELEGIAHDLYNYWFVQFDFPDEFRRPYKSSGGKMVYNKILKREIPEGWEVKNLLDIVEWVSGAQPPKATFIYQPQNGYVRFIQNRDYAGDTNVTYIKESKNNKVCDVFDIMMDKYGDAGRVRYGLAGAYNVALSKIKVNVRYGQEYIRKFLESDSVYNYLYNACMASTRASLNGEILGNLNIAIPNDTLLKNFEMRNKQIINQILQNKQENEILSNLRDFLLPMLMNGQATVSD